MTETTQTPCRLLVIDDNMRDQLIYRKTLQDFDLEFAGSGEAGLEELAERSFDLVILDFQLPGMDGRQVLHEIRATLGLDVPVVVVTGGGNENLAVDLLKHGAHDYVTKDDLQTPRVAIAVRGAIDRHRLDHARRDAEDELRRRRDELEATLQQLREAQAHLVQSEKMASLGQLVAGVAHEINNPLAYVSNNVAVLDRDVRQIAALISAYRAHFDSNVPQSIVEIEEQIDIAYTIENFDHLLSSTRRGLQRVREIVSGLRDFSRIDEAERKMVDLNEDIKSTLELLQYHVRRKAISLVVELGELPAIWCFAGKLNQVILNILMNAVQAVGDGGTIRIKTWATADHSEVSVAISDNGPGMSDAVVGKIFDPFFTTKPQGVGTGLGLWISYNIVEEHQGRIDVQSVPGQGSTFTITLPARLSDDPF